MYTRIKLSEDVVLVNWSGEKYRGKRPEVLYKAGEMVSCRKLAGYNGEAWTVFHVDADGFVYSNTRFVSKTGTFRNYDSPTHHTAIVADMCPVI